VLLPLQPHAALAFSAARQIGAALGDPDAHAFVAAVTAKEQPPAPRPAPDA
jgi:hypothetical protein